MRDDQQHGQDPLRSAVVQARQAPAVAAAPDALWIAIARKLFEDGHDEPAVLEALRRQGCLSYLRADVVRATRQHHRKFHRGDQRAAGFRAYQLGVLMWMCGGVLLVWSAADRMRGANSLAVGHSLAPWASGLFIGGLAAVLFGLYKSLRARAVAVQPPDRR